MILSGLVTEPLPRAPRFTRSMAPMPDVTCPSTVYFPVRNEQPEFVKQMKNCEFAELGFWVRAIPIVPRL